MLSPRAEAKAATRATRIGLNVAPAIATEKIAGAGKKRVALPKKLTIKRPKSPNASIALKSTFKKTGRNNKNVDTKNIRIKNILLDIVDAENNFFILFFIFLGLIF